MKTVKYVPVHGVPEVADAIDVGLKFRTGEEKQLSDAQAAKILTNPNFQEVKASAPASPSTLTPPISIKEG